MGRFGDAAGTSTRLWHTAGAAGVTALATVGVAASATTHEADRSTLAYYFLNVALIWVLCAVLRRFSHRRLLLVWPLMVTVGMFGASVVAPQAAVLCTSEMVIAFLFVGLTQRPWTSLVVWPFALVALWSTLDLPASQAAVRLTLASLIWTSVAELPAWLVTSLRATRGEVARLASTDALTGLANRRAWEMWLRDLDDDEVSLLVVDLDHFKRYNDAHGHLEGDLLLVEFAQELGRLAHDRGLVARWGGEEFAIVLPGRGAGSAQAFAESVMAVVPRSQTCSIGVATRRPGEDVGSVLRRADDALYRAKETGRSRVVAA